MTSKVDVSQDEIKKVLVYNSETGVFIWKERPLDMFRERCDRPRIRSRDSWNTRYANKPAGSLNSRGYMEIAIDGKRYSAHILAWVYEYGSLPDSDIDHVDNNKLNNAIGNLRLATKSQNSANCKRFVTNKSGYKGVYYSDDVGKYRATIRVNKKSIHLGYFSDPEIAHSVYLEAATEYFGEFARAG